MVFKQLFIGSLAVLTSLAAAAEEPRPLDVKVGMPQAEALDLAVPDWRGFSPRFKIACTELDDLHKVCTGNTLVEGKPAVVILTFVTHTTAFFEKERGYVVEKIQIVGQ